LFYLLSRGLGPDEARALLHWAFLGEVLKSIEPVALRRDAQRLAAARLSAAPAPELLQ
jgi:Fe-S cluster assembly scaffold protein SufB